MGADKGNGSNVSNIEDEDELDEEPGEVIESASPLMVGEERELGNSGLKKKLLKSGRGWETPEFGDEVTVHYVGTLLDGTQFDSTRDRDEPLTFNLGQGRVATGLDNGIITMKKEECALLTLPPELGNGVEGRDNVPPSSILQFEVELISWITVVDVCKDGGIIKKIMEKGDSNEQPGDLDEVLDAFGEEGTDTKNGIHTVPPNSVLNVDMELVSFKPVIDLTGDSKVFKKILKEGEGTLVANEGATVTIRYTARLEDGTVFEKRGVDGEKPLEFVTDEEQVIAGLDRAAATMKKGEHAVVTINHEHGFGNAKVQRDLATVPPCSNLVYEVKMLDVIKEKTSWEMNNQEKIEAAGRKKEEENLLFKSEKYQRAGKKYDKASDYVSEDGSFGVDDQKQVKALRVSCWLNGAACCLKLKDFQGAIKLCSKVLDIESYNMKALYRRAQAYMEAAELDVKKALEADPQNRGMKLIQRTLKQLQSESNKRDAKLYTKMFARITKDSPVAAKKLKVEKVEDEKRDEEVTAMETEKVVDSSALPNK